MAREIMVTFPGGKKVDARIGDFDIKTDQKVEHGGEASAPAPFDLFLASLATCGGFYLADFCTTRDISLDGVSLSFVCDYDKEAKRYTSMVYKVSLPSSFPDKYKKAVTRAIELCSVKRHLMDPPDIFVEIS